MKQIGLLKAIMLTKKAETDDILTFENGIRIAPLSLYAVLKEIHQVKQFQLIQVNSNRLELRLKAEETMPAFAEAKRALETYLGKNGVKAEIVFSEKAPETNPISGKYKHIIAMKKKE